jgi:predicted hotdog family 3-hydroxylacyl-ACP dehydratase
VSKFRPIEDYLPHRPPMLLIDELVEVTDIKAVVRTTIKPDCVFARDGIVHPAAMIEFMAQCCAILIGARPSGKGPRLGFIISCREVNLMVDSFSVGDKLELTAGKVHGQEALAVFSCTVSRDGVLCATMQLSAVDAEVIGTQPVEA